jgi:hypothetical protein
VIRPSTTLSKSITSDPSLTTISPTVTLRRLSSLMEGALTARLNFLFSIFIEESVSDARPDIFSMALEERAL